MKLALKFKDFPAPTAIFKDFQGLEFLFQNSRTFKVGVNPGLKTFSILKVIKVYYQGGLPRTFAQVW